MSEVRAVGQLQSGLRAQAVDDSRVASVTDRILRLYGLIEVEGTGEALLDLPFAVQFLELPSFSRGWHMSEGEVVTTGSYPTCDLGVHSFTYNQLPSGVRFYTGAKMIFVVTGLPTQRLVAHYQFEGRAIVPPVHTDVIAEDTI